MGTKTLRAIVRRIYTNDDGKQTQEVYTKDKRTFHLSGIAYAENAHPGDLIILDISEAHNHLTVLGTRYKDYGEKVCFSEEKEKKNEVPSNPA